MNIVVPRIGVLSVAHLADEVVVEDDDDIGHRRGRWSAPGRAAVEHRHLSGVGGLEPVGRRVPSSGSPTGGRPPRGTGSPRSVPRAWTTRRFWDAMHALPVAALAGVEAELALAMIDRFGLDTSSVDLDMTNFATFIAARPAKSASHRPASDALPRTEPHEKLQPPRTPTMLGNHEGATLTQTHVSLRPLLISRRISILTCPVVLCQRRLNFDPLRGSGVATSC